MVRKSIILLASICSFFSRAHLSAEELAGGYADAGRKSQCIAALTGRWTSEFVGRLNSEVFSAREGETPQITILNLDPVGSWAKEAAVKESVLTEFSKTHPIMLDLHGMYSLDDVDLNLSMTAPDRQKRYAEKLVEESHNSSDLFDRLVKLLFVNQKLRHIILQNSLQLTGFSPSEARFILEHLNSHLNVVLIVYSQQEMVTMHTLLQSIGIKFRSIDFPASPPEVDEDHYLPVFPENFHNGFELTYDTRAKESIRQLLLNQPQRFKQTISALQSLRDNPDHPSLNSKKLEPGNSITSIYGKKDIFRSIVTRAPGGHRILWRYDNAGIGRNLVRRIRILDVVDHSVMD